MIMVQIGTVCTFSGIATAAVAGVDLEHRPIHRRFAAALVVAGVALLAAAFPFL
jgi:hypothetical protein